MGGMAHRIPGLINFMVQRRGQRSARWLTRQVSGGPTGERLARYTSADIVNVGALRPLGLMLNAVVSRSWCAGLVTTRHACCGWRILAPRLFLLEGGCKGFSWAHSPAVRLRRGR